jgi:hypothetical protein
LHGARREQLMTMTSAAVGRRSRRDSEADVETEIYVRPQGQPMAWDRVMVLQIMKGLETRLPRVVPPPRNTSSRVLMNKRNAGAGARITPVPPPDEPNVFLTPWTPADPAPPWAHVDGVPVHAVATQAASTEETLVLDGRPCRVKVVKARPTRIPWLLFVMAFGIAFGIGQDRQLRRELGSKLRVTTAHAASIVAQRVTTAF